MSQGTVRYECEGAIARVTFDRPEARNAMTWAMYEALGAACERIRSDPAVRVAVFRGAGGKAFVAGTDIAQFGSFGSGDDGVAYERRIDACLSLLESLPVPTLAVVEGWAIGGGLAIAACCDLRITTPGARFGVPIARTLGNCLSIESVARLVAVLGVPTVKRMLLLADNLAAETLLPAGFVTEIVPPDALDARLSALAGQLAGHAPITMRVTKEAVRRLVAAGIPAAEDLVHETYGSADFREGVAAFVARRPPRWQGR